MSPLYHPMMPDYDPDDTEFEGIYRRFYKDGEEVGWEFDMTYLQWAEEQIKGWHKGLGRRGHFITEFADGSSSWAYVKPANSADDGVYILEQDEDNHRKFRLTHKERSGFRLLSPASYLSLGSKDSEDIWGAEDDDAEEPDDVGLFEELGYEN